MRRQVRGIRRQQDGLPALWTPAALGPTMWVRANASEYDGLPWVGEVGTLDAAYLYNDMAVSGTPQNGFTPGETNTNEKSASDSATPLSSLITASAYSLALLVRPTATPSFSPNAAARYAEGGMMNEVGSGGAYIGICYSTDGASAFHFGGGTYTGPVATCAAGSYHMIVSRFGSGTLGISVDGGTESTLAKSDVTGDPGVNATSRIAIGCGYSGARGPDARYLEALVFNYRLSDADIANLVSYSNARYALSL